LVLALIALSSGALSAQDMSQEEFDALQERAVAAREGGNLREALGLYEQLQGVASDDPAIAYNRGSIHLDLREFSIFSRSLG